MSIRIPDSSPPPGYFAALERSRPADVSPFDRIRRVRPDGFEYWSARDLMPLLGYEKWERFADAVERAVVSMAAQGHDVDANVSRLREPIAKTTREDFHLSRFAAYLVAMNGDPRKTEVAAAQAYFAIRTREAETAAPALSGPELLAHAVLEAQKMLAAKDERIAELEPKAEVADKLLDAEGDLSVRDAAQSLTRAGIKVGERRLFAELDRRGWIKRALGDGRYRVMQSAIDAGYMSVLPQSHYHPKTGVLVLDPPQPRITPKGLQRLLSDYDNSTGVQS
ncbi:phage antirepressor KilAC domain-containing protein [Mycobacterium celatum]|uniref:Uncharacterized protein n=1 Tax=Mycobacterium celatum TaxID=28045 RepID=A0A2G5PQD5_MYCCE|nr:phage antirepressor KilAC domain-containing protein [Mycobacterium celatum]PIB80527.1 hypothetical protein CQY23_03030 [Mycobacterium celatum]